ncbi:MAG TPA: 3-hydroxyisobutyryl-CoA hydrolase [Segeticoccus sp.]|uniref:3-hydroxyisobutyryl-CoA hydrolase n=1 Tax=Segeticoccus sp. TaxID=2706531 RepID=UPI002D7E3046|nr:3-hydroxyisobutyryl-CoA hydrolase [Segeticoccus sp.]HET8601963.1 3-hydroxyisobutyryl-CoA hydrolase [Segeticoccus sp.]
MNAHRGTDEVLFTRQGRLGRIRLNRPRALNALTEHMVLAMLAQLEEWTHDDRVNAVAIDGLGERGLCAGGDIRAVRQALMTGDGEAALRFWDDEYRLNALLHGWSKPVVSVMDGVVMGGGVGISAYADLRLATERSQVAMPEVRIGFFPDVGARWLLARAPGELGTHLALTGATATGADAVLCGLADLVVDSSRVGDVLAHLADGADLDAAAEAALAHPPTDAAARVAPLAEQRAWIDECYAGDDAVAIVERLHASPVEEARAAARTIESRSPLSVAVTLAGLRRAAGMPTLEQVLDDDRALGRAFVRGTSDGGEPAGADFVEGVRALLVDKDHAPRWRYSSLAEVDPAEVKSLFNA